MNKKELQAIISLKDKLSPHLKGIQGKIKVFAQDLARLAKMGFVALAAAVTAATVAFTKMIKETIRYGVKLDEARKTMAMTTEEFSKLAYAAEQEHTSLDSLSKVLPLLAKYADYAAEGMVTYKRQFDAMGVSVTNTNGRLKSSYELFLDMADYYSTATDRTKALAVATTLLGRRGAEMVPLLKLGREGIKALGLEAEQLGVVIDAKAAASMKHFDDKIVYLKTAMRGLSLSITTALLPVLHVVTEKLKNMDWAKFRDDAANAVKKTIFWVLSAKEYIGRWIDGMKVAWQALKTIVANVVSLMTNQFEYFKIGVEGMKIGFNSALANMLEGVRAFMDKIRPFAKILKIEVVEGAYNNLSDAIERFRGNIEDSQSAIELSRENIRTTNEYMRAMWDELARLNVDWTSMEDIQRKVGIAFSVATKEIEGATTALKKNGNEISTAGKKAKDATEKIATFKSTFESWAKQTKTFGADVASSVTKTMDGFAAGTAKAFRQSIEEGKNFSESMRDMMRQLMYDMLEDIMRSGIQQAFKSLFNGIDSSAGSAGGMGGGGWIGGIMSIIGSFFGHDGGMVTKQGIKKYHNGGLAQDEVPTILLTGERVLNRQQTREYDKGQSGTGDVNVNLTQVIQAWDVTDLLRNKDALAAAMAEAIRSNGPLRETIMATTS